MSAVVGKGGRDMRVMSITNLCGVVNILQCRVTGHHSTQIRQRTQAIEPAFCVVLLRALEKQYYYKHKGEQKKSLFS